MTTRRSVQPGGAFAAVWAADAVSKLGSQVSLVALPLIALLQLHGSAFDVGVLGALGTGAFLIFGLPAGVVVDRMDRRRMLIGCDLVRAGLLISIPIVGWLGRLSLLQLGIVAFLAGSCTVLFDSAHQSFVPELVGDHGLITANSRLGMDSAVASGLGPAAAGWLIQLASAAGAVLLDAASFLISAACLVRLPAKGKPERADPRGRLVPELFDGLGRIWRDGVLRRIIIAGMVMALFDEMLATVALIALARLLPHRTGLLGTLLAVPGLGAIAVGKLGPGVVRRLGSVRALRLGAVGSALGGLVAANLGGGGRLALFAAGAGCVAGGTVLFNVISLTYRQRSTPPNLRGRVNASARFACWGLIPIGALLGGLTASVDLRLALWLAAIGKLLAVVPLLSSRLAGIDAAGRPRPITAVTPS